MNKALIFCACLSLVIGVVVTVCTLVVIDRTNRERSVANLLLILFLGMVCVATGITGLIVQLN